MRKLIKDNILKTFRNIYEAHNELRSLTDRKNYKKAAAVLEKCRGTASAITEEVKRSDGGDHIAVSFFEEYCQTIDRLSGSISGESSGRRLQKELDKKLIKAENSLKNDVKVRLEIVFMPYKAAMWDSLESVWRAAYNDPDCDVYVVPIPCYERDPDGSLGELSYDGNAYPDYVPITDYNEYELAVRRPDIIYIHNAYDHANTVTSVPPEFYSSELKKYTSMLVYIPYFVLGYTPPDDRETVKRMEHFVLVPGVVNADRVIVQSEDMRSVYINVLLERSDGSSAVRAFLEKKILGLGSPKYDKLAKTDIDIDSVPEEWKRVIYNPDGTAKKVVFYNTAVVPLLNYTDQWLGKLKSALNVFRENTDDTALLWRPHPLTENTMRSMCPSVLAEYLEIKDKYIREGWGIFDDTADLDRAFVLSDRYYGDSSSVAEMFRKAGKPVLVRSYTATGENK